MHDSFGEGLYTVEIGSKFIQVVVTEYIPEDPQVIDSTPESSYEGELEDIQYEAATGNDLLNYFLNDYVFEQVDESICKQLSEKINENSI